MRTHSALSLAASVGTAIAAVTLCAMPVMAQPSPDRAAPARTAAPRFAGEPVVLKSGDATVKATIETPTSTGQHGAVVIVATSENMHAATTLAQRLAERGVIALAYQAPDATPDAARSAVDALRLRGDVKRDRLGVIGFGTGSDVIDQIIKMDGVQFAVAIRTTKDAIDAHRFSKLTQKVLVVQGSADPFSPETEKLTQSVEKRARNVTLWAMSDDDVTSIGTQGSMLTDRVVNWTMSRVE